MSTYSWLLDSVLLPSYYGLKGRPYGRYSRFLNKSQWWPDEKLREFQWTELQKLLDTAFDHVPFYKQKYSAAGVKRSDIRSFEDFSKLPPLTREEIRAHREELKSAAFQGKSFLHATGGSSGSPTRFYVSMDSYDWRCAASARGYSWSGCRLGERTFYLWGAPVGKVSPKQERKMNIFRWLRNELMVPTFSQSPEFWASAHSQALKFKPEYMVGYVSSIEEFCRYLIDSGKRLPGIKAVMAAAEPVHQSSRDLVDRALHAPLFNNYGSREFMAMATECSERRGLHVHMENILLETAHPANDGPSPILVTDLHNHAMPFLRYEIGDVGILSNRKCACGRGLSLLESVDGRVLDVLRTADGRIVPGELFPHLLKDVPEVMEFQVWQKALDHIRVSLVLSSDLSDQSRSLLQSEISKWMGASTHVEILRVDAIPRRASGKRRVTIGLGQEP